MCLSVNKKNDKPYKAKPVARTATKAITVYKVIKRTGKAGVFRYVSPVKRFPYVLGKTYNSKLQLEVDNFAFGLDCRVEHGLHSFATIKAAKQCGWSGRIRIAKAIIPKGAKYFVQHGVDNNGKPFVEERASDKLRLIKIIK